MKSLNDLQYNDLALEQVLFDADDSQPDYIGLNIKADAGTDDPNWKIFKFTYSGANITAIKVKIGKWDDRAVLF